ncbi:MAG: hypothetical protein JF886_10815 [Candidatus Dormibacteraeota bacterium]|uniref:Uncharacterized protein n=1 Tax=Candidatus Aeolococcus gillhamiae TaxID=3127015 RepID=A0A934JUQ4_9BACT|nr:hypothetical protein [Candidatus Dormibacteraeota bacterium]
MTPRARPLLRVLTRLLAIVSVFAALTVVGAKTSLAPAVEGCAQASGVHHAALVAQHGDGRPPVTTCVSFGTDSITGDELLTAARAQGVESQTLGSSDSGYGKAVCQIDYEPAQYPSTCWSGSSPYWALFVSRGGGAWTESSLGISSQTFRDGDAEGFRYEGQSDGSPPPSPRGVCPVTTPAPTAAATKAAAPAAHRATPPTLTPSAAGVDVIAAAATPTPSTEPSNGATPTTAAFPSTNRSAPLPVGSNTGALVAGILAALLAAALLVQLLRRRRQGTHRAPPP